MKKLLYSMLLLSVAANLYAPEEFPEEKKTASEEIIKTQTASAPSGALAKRYEELDKAREAQERAARRGVTTYSKPAKGPDRVRCEAAVSPEERSGDVAN